MAMEYFTEAYDKARTSLKDYEFSGDWKKIMKTDVAIADIVASADGPNYGKAAKLDTLRAKIKEKVDSGESEGKVILSMVGENGKLLNFMKKKDQTAAAAIKMLRHFYLEKKAGAQSVWIFAQPYSFHKWVFDEIGASGFRARSKLDKVDEVYNATARKNLANGVSTARAWCQKCVAKLGSPDQGTKALVKTWFGPTDAKANAAAKTLLDGFKKITALLGSTKLIFSDEPLDRMKGKRVKGQKHYRDNWEDYAFVDGRSTRERLDVVYIQKGTLDAFSGGDGGWLAIQAIIHELSHRVLDTDDVVYDYSGLQPSDLFTFKKAIRNADSWGYFAADLNGMLPEKKRKEVYKKAAELDE